ncbi:cytochrome c-type biogenesis protein CcmH [Chromatiaceae bacterium AAb-1]|nr:cytochrome c-type biogenesis protein CcmH [Chromatiaceae bacterium AAb-1]
MKYILLLFVLLLQLPLQAGEQEILPFETDAQRQLYLQLIAELRCPQCQNQNIAGSNAVVSEDMRQKTYELIMQGKSRQEILDYMIERYGYFVHYQPPVNRYTLLLWLAPLLMLTGLLLVLLKKRRQQPAPDEIPLSSELDSIIEAYRSKKP